MYPARFEARDLDSMHPLTKNLAYSSDTVIVINWNVYVGKSQIRWLKMDEDLIEWFQI